MKKHFLISNMGKQLSIFGKFDPLKGAQFSDDGKHRFILWRVWNEKLPKVMFIGLNPSRADAETNDPTINRVISFAKSWGYGGIYMANCFTFITPYPEELKEYAIDSEFTDTILKHYAKQCKLIIFCWGTFKIVKETGRDKQLMKIFPNAKVLKINIDISPRHPLYVPIGIMPIHYKKNLFFKKIRNLLK